MRNRNDMSDAFLFSTTNQVEPKKQDLDPHFYEYTNWKITENFCPPKIFMNDLLVESYEDWSKVRSPSRAKRRMKNGHRQNVRMSLRPSSKVIHDRVHNIMYCHPEIYWAIKKHIDLELSGLASRVTLSPLFTVMPETIPKPGDLSLGDLLKRRAAFINHRVRKE